MKTVCLAAALLLAGGAAHAGSSIAFDVDGHKIRITAPSNCQSLSCLQISGLSGINLNGLRSGKLDDDDAGMVSAQPSPAATIAAPVAPAPQAQANATQPAPLAAPVTGAPAAPAPAPAPMQSAPAPATGTDANANPAPVTASVPTPPPPAAAAAAPAPDPNSPVGLWATEDNKGNVRIEPCGQNLCGYAEKSGEKILINMKPKENKWVGRIHDPDGGGNYDSTIALKGTSTLKVQGCAFGGLFCGGQTWKRAG
jgi:uncharacterized protein (DUF2147 family)